MPLVLVHNDVVANPAHAWNDVETIDDQRSCSDHDPLVYQRGFVERLFAYST